MHADVSWSPPERIRLWSQFVVFCLIWVLFWVSEMGQIWDFRPFWSCSVDFNHYDASLTATGHIWGFWALSGECVGVNADRGGGIFLMLCIKFCLVFSNVLPWVVLFCMSNASKIIETNVLCDKLDRICHVGFAGAWHWLASGRSDAYCDVFYVCAWVCAVWMVVRTMCVMEACLIHVICVNCGIWNLGIYQLLHISGACNVCPSSVLWLDPSPTLVMSASKWGC